MSWIDPVPGKLLDSWVKSIPIIGKMSWLESYKVESYSGLIAKMLPLNIVFALLMFCAGINYSVCNSMLETFGCLVFIFTYGVRVLDVRGVARSVSVTQVKQASLRDFPWCVYLCIAVFHTTYWNVISLKNIWLAGLCALRVDIYNDAWVAACNIGFTRKWWKILIFPSDRRWFLKDNSRLISGRCFLALRFHGVWFSNNFWCLATVLQQYATACNIHNLRCRILPTYRKG